MKSPENRPRGEPLAQGKQPACAVCEVTLPVGQRALNGALPTCQDPACVTLGRQQAFLPKERYRLLLKLQKPRILAQRRAREKESARRGAQRQVIERQHRELAARYRSQHPLAPGHSLRIVELPLIERPMVPVGPGRRARYEASLRAAYQSASTSGQGGGRKVPAEAQAAAEVIASPPALSDGQLARLCTLCGGGCCTRGGDSAYLDAVAVGEVLRNRPQESEAQFVARYLSRLPARVVADSCINHGPAGCALPRSLRSKTCNAFYCDPIRDLEPPAHAGNGAGEAVIAAQRAGSYWDRFAPGRDLTLVTATALDTQGAETTLSISLATE